MAGMKRFVTYIYAYEDGKKGSNIGFAKIEIRGEDCRIEIHMRGVYVRQAICKVHLFREKDGSIEGFPIGEMKIANGNGNCGLIIKEGRIAGSPFGMNHMEGIILLSEDDRIFASRWKEGRALDVRRENVCMWQPELSSVQQQPELSPVQQQPELSPVQQQPELSSVQQQPELSSVQQQPVSLNAMDVPAPISQMQAAESVNQAQPQAQHEGVGQEENVQATELPVRNIFPGYDWQAVWEKLIQNHTVYMPFQDRAAECVQIELKNLRELPNRYWYLGNNSFMLHGFFNYHYLVVGRTGEGRWFIGVPGIYQRQERVMAAIFGFPEFIPVMSEAVNDEKGEPVNRFGCWYRYIEE